MGDIDAFELAGIAADYFGKVGGCEPELFEPDAEASQGLGLWHEEGQYIMRLEYLLCLCFAEDEGAGAESAIIRIDLGRQGSGGAAILTGYDAGHFGEGAAIPVGYEFFVIEGNDRAAVSLLDLIGSAAIGALQLMGAGGEMERCSTAFAL